ncbi:MAG TPA: thioredoxin domain-containing protein [Candidatus Polarisedimenticolia bacterium]|nr:thioredoxin domain-containing protein [Candidatus Polarisedimenticolia bacterium]
MAETLLEITDGNFESEVARSSTPVLLDFSAEWCSPCKKLAPIVADLARQYAGRLKVGHVDVETNPASAARFGVMAVPTFIFFKDGRPAETIAGAPSRRELEQAILKVIS